jgi:hypothetical protein
MYDQQGEELNIQDQVLTGEGEGIVSGRLVYSDNRERVLIALNGRPARLGGWRGPGTLLAFDPQAVRKLRSGIFLPAKPE